MPDQTSFMTKSPEQTAFLGHRLASYLEPGDTVLVNGDLGAGKTCFIQGICSGLDTNEPVTSPTFTLVNEYDGVIPIAHFDLYRLDDAGSVLDIGFEEYLETHVCLIAWGDKFLGVMPSDAIIVRIGIELGTQRVLIIKGVNQQLSKGDWTK